MQQTSLKENYGNYSIVYNPLDPWGDTRIWRNSQLLLQIRFKNSTDCDSAEIAFKAGQETIDQIHESLSQLSKPILEQEIAVTAKWWTHQLRSFQDITEGLDLDEGRRQFFLSLALHSQDQISEQVIQQFEAKLIEEMRICIPIAVWGYCSDRTNGLGGSNPAVFCLSNDYEPDGILRDVCKELGIDGSRLPIKTVTEIREGSVLAKGRTNQSQELFTEAKT